LLKNIQKHADNNEENEITENYKRFNGKKITIVIFTLDSDIPHYIHWSDINTEQSQMYDEYIKKILFKSLYEKMVIDSKYLYYFYSYYRKFYSEKGITNAVVVIDNIVDNYKKNKEKNATPNRKFPTFIDDFFYQIKFLIENSSKKEKNKILSNYDDKDFFNEKLKEKLHRSINHFLNIKNSEDFNDSDNEL
jgi:hypothetical protein